MDYKLIEQQLDELNLDGYKHIKNNEWELPENLFNWLENNGFEEIGEGYYSKVYQSKTENFVVKINKGEMLDKGYFQFIDFCQQNKCNPHLPKLGKIKKYEDWYILFIEKLEEFDNIKYGFLATKRTWRFFNDSIKFFNKNKDEDKRINYCKKYFNRTGLDKEKVKLIFKQVIECITLMSEFSEKTGITYFDLHEGNLMMRGNTLVLSDPVSYGPEAVY